MGKKLRKDSEVYPVTKENCIHLLFLVLLGSLLYFNSLHGPFLFDDNVYVLNHLQITEGGGFLSYFSKGFCEGASQDCPFYRPLVSLFFRLDYLIWGENPFGFHLSSLISHLLVLVLFYVVIIFIFGNKLMAVVASLVFAVHPVHVESVAFVTARTDPPATIFFLLSLLGFHFYLKGASRSYKFLIFSVMGFAMALFTKEIGMSLPVILLMYDLLWVRPWAGIRNLFQRWLDYLPFAAVGILYIIMRSLAMGSVSVENIYGIPLGVRLMNAMVLLWEYLSLMVVPYPLMIFHEVPKVLNIGNTNFLLALFVLGFLTGLLLWNRKEHPGFLFSGIWFLITLVPVLGIIPLPSASVMERSAYLPSIGFCLGIGFLAKYLVNRWEGDPRGWVIRGMIGVLVSILIIFSVTTVQRNQVWQDEVLIWEDLYRKTPGGSPMGHINLALAYHERGELDKAEREYLLALRYHKELQEKLKQAGRGSQRMTQGTPPTAIYQRLGMIYQKKGRTDAAIQQYRHAIQLGLETPQVYYNLGLEIFNKGDQDQAISLFQKAIRLDPDYYKAQLQMGMIYGNRREVHKAIEAFKEVVRIDPGDDRSHFRLGALYDTAGSTEKAREHYQLFLQNAKPHALMDKMMVQAKKRLSEMKEGEGAHP
ncbi:MAG TPA: tetratricopeptide repeat protein [Nitrospiria bacterium]